MSDSWGRYYTYAISPAYADTAASTTVYKNCRSENVWVFEHTRDGGTIRNINPDKARFCCPGIAAHNFNTDLMVLTNGFTHGNRSNVAGDYAAPDTMFTGSYGDMHESDAIVIVSHGQNGVNAFLANGSGGRGTGSFTAAEAENADGDIRFDQNMSDTTPGSYFDDIVISKSQFQLMAALNDGSCTRPFFSYTPEMLKPKGFTEDLD